ncbi:GntR family transcriptional regulator [Pseudoclavibacter sp. VKM Ac-2867]|uniref:GntR family transcriptional regulator n=1 Tax=Pseudoclavibacter sp. VKM Ac-2867 TaxID=2783829 RepID=UPI00188D1BCF|nr:GntR family transcriptional regulator [Pseudoclavibacter sp. VKM Ac-2867]MBF4458874.1 GntR family transcriptional regulator [Pseudoclavibacter sp. VKM Ac-2867]
MSEGTSEQVAAHFRGLILAGRIGAGERLPTVRQTARDFGVALGTAARAYRLLEAEGTIVTRGAAGTRVADQPSTLPGAVTAKLRAAVQEALRSGTSQTEIMNALTAIWDSEQ